MYHIVINLAWFFARPDTETTGYINAILKNAWLDHNLPLDQALLMLKMLMALTCFVWEPKSDVFVVLEI